MINNKFSKYYFNIISNAKARILNPAVKIEKHHILPKSLGGTNEASNLVSLTLREHFICHKLLIRMTEGKERTKMVYALWKMCHSTKEKIDAFKLTSRTYDSVKSLMSKSRTSADFTPEWREKISNSRKGKVPWNKGIARTQKEKSKISATRKLKANDPTWNIRPPCSAEKAQKIKEANLGKKWVHKKDTRERKYVSPNEFTLLCSQGWSPGLGPKS